MSLYYRTLLIPFTKSIQVDFTSKNTDPGNLLDLATDTLNSFVFNTITNQLSIDTTSLNYTIEVYKDNVLFETSPIVSGNYTFTVSNSLGIFTYFVIGPVGMTFTSVISFVITTPAFVGVQGFGSTQTIT